MDNYTKLRIKKYIDLLDDSDAYFLIQIHTIITKHLKRTGRL